MRIGGHTIEFTDVCPNKAGKYLWQNSMGVEVITVVDVPAKQDYGIDWQQYFGVAEMRGRNVAKLKGTFVVIEE